MKTATNTASAPAATSPTEAAAITTQALTLTRATSAFDAWENDFRHNPDSFYKAEETAAMEVATVSEARGIHFMALLRDQPVDANTPPAHGEYWPGQGGIYICTMAASMGLPARHLIAAAADADKQDLIYGPYVDVPGATSQLDGPGNTRALIAAGNEHTAAVWASNYTADDHTDFHLPSRIDLVMAHAHAAKHFNTDGWYLSSTQDSRYRAFVQGFAYGDSGWSYKDYERRVRAFRWIQL